MNCERLREQIPECLAGRLDPGAREQLIAHLETCSACRGELSELGAAWRGLASIPVVEPDHAMRSRFLDVLEAYRAGMDSARSSGRETLAVGARRSFAAPWFRAAWATALAATLLIVGGLAGRYLGPARTSSSDMARVQQQLDSLRQLVAVSMLQDESPTARIRGVSYSSQMTRPDREMVQSLLHTLNHDTNVNVRLSAVDALEKLAGNSDIRRALVDALPLQDSPLVQIALIDVLAQSNDRDALPGFKKLVQDPQTDESARQRATAAIRKLEVKK
jgi:HEAT repeat protein